MADIVGTVSGAIDLTRKLLKVASIAKDAEAKLIIADLQVELAELKSSLADVMNENTRLKQRMRAREEAPKLVFKDGAYFKEDGEGPYCPACQDSKGKLIRLAEPPPLVGNDFGRWACPICKEYFGAGRLS